MTKPSDTGYSMRNAADVASNLNYEAVQSILEALESAVLNDKDRLFKALTDALGSASRAQRIMDLLASGQVDKASQQAEGVKWGNKR
jgi:signal transduction histidine kinase